MMKAASFLTSLSSDDEDDAMDEKISKEEEREMMIQDPKLCEELDTMRREIASLEEIVRQKRNALEKIRVMIRKKESIYQRDKKKFMNTTGTWVADMNLKKMATKNTVMQKKLSSANRKANTLQAQEIKIKLQIEDLRREKEVFEDAFKRMSRDVERLQHVTENLQNQLSEAERDSSLASTRAKSCQEEYLEQSKDIQNQIRRLDKKIYNKRRKKKRYMSGKDLERNRLSKSEEMSPTSTSHKEMDTTSSECRKQWWETVKEKTNVDSVETLLRDFREFEESKMGKLMQANKLILQLEQLRAEKKSVLDEKEQTPSRKCPIRLDTHDKQEMTVKIMSQIDSHHNLAKSMSPFVTRLRDIVNNKQLMNRVEDALGVSQNALTSSPSDTNTDSSSSCVASMKAVCERLGHLQTQIMLIMQYFKLVFLLDGKQDPKGGPSDFFLPQYEHMDRETILKQIDSMRETVLSKIERGKTFETNREVVRPLTNAELRQETYETMNTCV
eukprot:g4813.t1